ncbi:MAG: DUF3006 domain-containing protein [Methanomicrobiales archaeon HGW-Methanomicrobiales-3]|jgi:hypothetical protein|nr:MAG: DUF3006 domain-containing protein [Methanomicrobiales archaeon HGW-Methanomicrobiales-3]
MQVTVDRIEGGIAILIGREDETVRITIPAGNLPKGCREGDILTLALERDEVATAEARSRIAAKIEKLRVGRKDSGP